MAKPKYDGVIEAVHYHPDGKVAWVRVYERRGATFSDRMIVDRPTLIERMKAGRKYMAGKRVPLMAATFETSTPVHFHPNSNGGSLVTGDRNPGRDDLAGVHIV
jgi:hypothetical protein